jgi:hypothetical protein
LRYMMFLNCEWPAIPAVPIHEMVVATGNAPAPAMIPSPLQGIGAA